MTHQLQPDFLTPDYIAEQLLASSFGRKSLSVQVFPTQQIVRYHLWQAGGKPEQYFNFDQLPQAIDAYNAIE